MALMSCSLLDTPSLSATSTYSSSLNVVRHPDHLHFGGAILQHALEAFHEEHLVVDE
jgi:hypothetical protein